MEYRDFGKCGFQVSAIGFGAGHIGGDDLSDREAEAILHQALDAGITLIDTARSYGLSEERIGKFLAHRRHQFILSSKGGYTFGDTPDWSYAATMGSIEESLTRMKTDCIDIYHLHSCDLSILHAGAAIAALDKAREQGKIRIVAYSGENEALGFAIGSHRFGSIQCSVNLFDQHCLDRFIPSAFASGMGIIAKRPLGNAVWRFDNRPDGHGHALYFDRFHRMKPDPEGLPWHELALRFSAYSPGISSVIAGSRNRQHLQENLRCMEQGPLPPARYDALRQLFTTLGDDHDGLI